MVQFTVLSGKTAGSQALARRFPFRIGRGTGLDLVLDEPGVWECHACLGFLPAEGFRIAAEGEALMTVNGQPARDSWLRNGDRVGLGSVQLQFWLAEVRQRRLGFREGRVWAVVVLVTAAQIALLYHLLR